MSTRVNKDELYKGILRHVDVDPELLDKIISSLHKVVLTELSKGKTIKIPNLCTFYNKHLKKKTLIVRGKTIDVPEKESMTIRPASIMIRKLNGQR